MSLYIVLMGMQGAGKGTQSDILKETLAMPHVTSGGMFRAMKTLGTPLAKQITDFLEKGLLVPDDLTIAMVEERLGRADVQEKGVILDGFPRTVPQAQALDALLAKTGKRISVVPFFVITEPEAMRRLGGRRVCTKDDNHIYHVDSNPPKVAGICDEDGAPLKTRSDDEPEAIRKRISAYNADTKPVLDYYREQGLLRDINAEQAIEKVTEDLLALLKTANK